MYCYIALRRFVLDGGGIHTVIAHAGTKKYHIEHWLEKHDRLKELKDGKITIWRTKHFPDIVDEITWDFLEEGK